MDLGLRQLYQEDLDFCIKLRQLSAWAFVQVNQIQATFEELKNTLPIESDHLVQHFEHLHRSLHPGRCSRQTIQNKASLGGPYFLAKRIVHCLTYSHL